VQIYVTLTVQFGRWVSTFQKIVVFIFKVGEKVKSDRKCVFRTFCYFNLDISIIVIFVDQIRSDQTQQCCVKPLYC